MSEPVFLRSADRDLVMTGEPRAKILNVQRMSTEDGPGIRTTVFLKGCSLACGWCHNPESLTFEPQVVWHDWRCVDCISCRGVCPHEALVHQEGHVEIVRAVCDACGKCVDVCPSTALETFGHLRTVSEVFEELIKDRAFYEESGGGVTISGGEPGMWPEFVEALLGRCRDAGIHTAVDTTGMCAPRALDAIVRNADLVLYDVKEIDMLKHARFTGRPNTRLLRNLVSLAESMSGHEQAKALWIRSPLVPGATATVENVRGIGGFLGRLGTAVSRWELCAFNNLARDKYERLGMKWEYAETPLLSKDELSALEQVARESGVDPSIVIATGPTRIAMTSEEAIAS
jgi:pyruvate formate lyase activating enzyme